MMAESIQPCSGERCGLCQRFDLCDVEKNPIGETVTSQGETVKQGYCRAIATSKNGNKHGGLTLRVLNEKSECMIPHEFLPRVVNF